MTAKGKPKVAVASVIPATRSHHLSLHCNLRIPVEQLKLPDNFEEREGDVNHHVPPPTSIDP